MQVRGLSEEFGTVVNLPSSIQKRPDGHDLQMRRTLLRVPYVALVAAYSVRMHHLVSQ